MAADERALAHEHQKRPRHTTDNNGRATIRPQPRGETVAVPLRSRVVKRSIVIAGHKTSVSLEDAFWDGLKVIASERHEHLSTVVGNIDTERQHGNLSSALRLFVLDHYRK